MDFKSLNSIQKQKKKDGPYVGVFVGNSQSNEGKLQIGPNPFIMDSYNGGMMVGIELGYSWKVKRFPFEVGLEFEGYYSSSEIRGILDPTILPPAPGTVTSAQTDLNAVSFLFNGWVGLDLWRYRARLGRFVTGWRPYIGAGVGGAQLYYRNTLFTTRNVGAVPEVVPFEVDEFVLAWQWFAGLEYRVTDKVGVYAEYKNLHFDASTELTDYTVDFWSGGVRIRY